jgi:dUTP pyrophosphatase
MSIKYKLTPEALALKAQGICDCTPSRGTPLSAGMDLKACLLKPLHILPYETVKVGTGLHIWLGEELGGGWQGSSIPLQLAGLLLPRSSAKGLQLENTVGLLDCDYQQEVFLKLYNKTEDVVMVAVGERIAQLVVVPVIMDDWLCEQEDWSETSRLGGDGSTGKF